LRGESNDIVFDVFPLSRREGRGVPFMSSAEIKKRGRRWLWSIPLFLIAAGLWYVLHAVPNRMPTGFAEKPTVGVASIERGPIRVILDQLGTVTPLGTVAVQSQISGQLLSVGFREGQEVRKGEFLAQIDDRPYQAQLQKDLGQLARDEGLLAQAKADLARYLILEKQNSIALQQVEDQRFLVHQYEGNVAADQGTVAADRVNIDYCRIVAPVSGRLGLRQVDPGNYVTPSLPNGLVVVTQLRPISVVFSIPQRQLAAVQERLATGAKLPVEAYSQDDTVLLAQGELATLDNQMDTATGTVKMRAVFPNEDERLFPNEFVNAHLLVETRSDVVRVPVAAIQQGQQGSFVWKLVDDKVKAQAVALGPIDGLQQQVLSGLEPGDRVVIDGTDRLRDGMMVRIAGEAGTPTGAAPAGKAPGRQHGKAPQ